MKWLSSAFLVLEWIPDNINNYFHNNYYLWYNETQFRLQRPLSSESEQLKKLLLTIPPPLINTPIALKIWQTTFDSTSLDTNHHQFLHQLFRKICWTIWFLQLARWIRSVYLFCRSLICWYSLWLLDQSRHCVGQSGFLGKPELTEIELN